jgi:hypothetical protein
MWSFARKALAIGGLIANVIYAVVRVPRCPGQLSAIDVVAGIVYFSAVVLFLSLAFEMRNVLKMRIICYALLLNGLSLIMASFSTACASSPSLVDSATRVAAFGAFCYFALASATLYEISLTRDGTPRD